MARYHISGEIRHLSAKFRFRSSLLLFFFVLLAAAFDMRSFSQQMGEGAIQGVVNDASGRPVPDAVILLQQAGVVIARTQAGAHGSFVFAAVQSGNYLVSAEKADMHASASVSIGKKGTRITLVVVANAADSKGMDFSDKPGFTVAGITDWTAVGGHGSDASLRTSETLAQATTTLKQDKTLAAQTDDKERTLRAAVAASPQSFTAHRELGRFCLQKGAYREAEISLETAYRIDPADWSNEYDLVLAYKEAGDLERAREHVNHLLQKANNANVHRLAGDVDEVIGDALSAEREYEAAVRLEPSELNEFSWGAELLLHRAVWPAVEVFRKGAVTYPKSARMRSALGAALFASAQYEEAAQRLCEASDLNPKDSEPYIFLGEIEMAAPAPLVCVEAKLERFVLEHPENSRAYYYDAMSILKHQAVPEKVSDVGRARSLLMQSVEIDPTYGEAYLQLGILSANKKDYAGAIGYFNRAIEVNPQLADAYYRLGVAYQRTGAEEKAKQEFDKHREAEKAQAEAVEQQRHKVKQFIVVLQEQVSHSN